MSGPFWALFSSYDVNFFFFFFCSQVKRLYKMFVAVDCLQLEVNPLAETPQGMIYTADAKLGFDDNASFRQKAIFDMEDTTESDPREVEAASWNLNYVQVGAKK